MTTQGTTHAEIPRSHMVEKFGDSLEFDKPLAPFTGYQTGGPARYFLHAHSAEEVERAVKAANEVKVPFYLIGGGSNLLVADSGFDGLVVRVEIKGMRVVDETTIDCGAGEDLMALVDFCAEQGLSGMEFAAGIAGTVGGAIYGNAGAYGNEIGNVLTSVTLVDREGNIKTVEPEYCKFAYRTSHLKQSHEIVVRATLALEPGDKEQIKARVDEIIDIRESKLPPPGNSAGCFFKNIPDASQPHGKLAAGKLLEEVGAKEMSVGGAKVYERHANIIVNTGSATSKDIRRLADMMKKKVHDEFGVDLEEEVIQIGEFE